MGLGQAARGAARRGTSFPRAGVGCVWRGWWGWAQRKSARGREQEGRASGEPRTAPPGGGAGPRLSLRPSVFRLRGALPLQVTQPPEDGQAGTRRNTCHSKLSLASQESPDQRRDKRPLGSQVGEGGAQSGAMAVVAENG